MQAQQLLTANAVTVSPDEDLVTAARLMRRHHIGFLVVTAADDRSGRPLGVLTDRDIVIEALAADIDPHQIKVGDVMSANPLLAAETETVEILLNRMRSMGVRRAPVINSQGRLAGVISFDDILHYMAELLSHMAGSIKTQRSIESEARA